MSKKIVRIFFCLILIFCFFISNKINAVTSSGDWGSGLTCANYGGGSPCVYMAALPDADNFQAWKANISGHVEGHGSFGPDGGKYGVDLCITPNGMMWTGACWNIVDSNTGGVVGDGRGDFNHAKDIGGDDVANLSYANVAFYVNDATIYPFLLTVYGRQVSIDQFNQSASSISDSQQVDITWATDQVTRGVKLDYSGPITCDVGSSGVDVPDNYGTTCTPTGTGTATFTLYATGYGGRNDSRPKTVSSGPLTVNISSTPSSALYRCSGAGTCIRDDVYGNTTDPTCGNICIAPPPPSSCADNASASLISAPSGYLLPGGVYPVTMTVRNSGSVNWTYGEMPGWQFLQRSGYSILTINSNPYNSVIYNPPYNTYGHLPTPINAGSSVSWTWNLTVPSNNTTNAVQGNLIMQMHYGGTPATGCPVAYFGNQASYPFLIAPQPTISNLTISSPTVFPDSSTQYTINIKGSDTTGASKITHQYALINWRNDGVHNTSGTDERGYLLWYYDTNYTGWNSFKDKKICSGNGGTSGGGGVAAIYPGAYGDQYINLVSCSTSNTSSNEKTTTFVVTFTPLFTTPKTGNDISGYVFSNASERTVSGWIRFPTNFSITSVYPPMAPTISGTATYVNTIYPFGFNSKDPGGNNIKYEVNWGDGSPNIFLPSSGYTASESTLTGNYSWSSAGSYTIQARTINSLGGISGWTSNVVSPANLPINGSCGSGATTYASGDSAYSGSYCSSGTATGCSSGVSPNCSFPAQGSSVTWTCSGLYGGSPSGTCTASRSNITKNVSVSVNNLSGGTVTGGGISCGATCYASVVLNSTITLTATPNSSYWKFNGWGEDCSFAGTSKTCILNVNSDKNVTASFSPKIFDYTEF